MIINLGAGKKLIKDAINCDITNYPGIDMVFDMNKYPYPFADNSIDGIHASHVIEHLKSQEDFINECSRILKSGGFLRLCVPHSSNVVSVGCMGHNRTYSYNTFNDYLSKDFYMFGKAKYKTKYQRLNWWFEHINWDDNVPRPILCLIIVINPVMNFLINLYPQIFENVWCYWVGGAREVIWEGEKI